MCVSVACAWVPNVITQIQPKVSGPFYFVSCVAWLRVRGCAMTYFMTLSCGNWSTTCKVSLVGYARYTKCQCLCIVSPLKLVISAQRL